MSSKLAEWARDHYLGPVVTFGEWISYSPPKVGGKPGFSLTAPGAAPTAAPVKVQAKHHGFVPNIPAKLSSPAGSPLPGEGVWRVLETGWWRCCGRPGPASGPPSSASAVPAGSSR